MTRKQRQKIARTNGAKAAGAKSPEGIETSSRNALRFGLTSKTLVLFNECPVKFAQVHQGYVDKFQPRDAVEMDLVDEMVAARWRQQRIWGIQTAMIDLEVDRQHNHVALPKGVTEPGRLALAFTALAKEQNTVELLLRYETSYSRMHDRAMKALYRLREEALKEEEATSQPAPVPAPSEPELQSGSKNSPDPAPLPAETPAASTECTELRNDPESLHRHPDQPATPAKQGEFDPNPTP